jgi:hypothetical protein
MDLQETVSKILRREVTLEEAMKFANKQFGVLSTYLRENPPLPSLVSNQITVAQIPVQSLSEEILRYMKGREAYVDNDGLLENIYYGDVFENISKESELSPLARGLVGVLDEQSKNFNYIQIVTV